MNEKDLGKALLAGEHPVNIDELTRNVLKRDRRRIWIVAVLCVLAWLFVVLLPWSTVLPSMARFKRETISILTPPPGTTVSPEKLEQTRLVALTLKAGLVAMFFGSVALMIAVAFTVALITVSRRATLRQLNVRLGQISDQLKVLAERKA